MKLENEWDKLIELQFKYQENDDLTISKKHNLGNFFSDKAMVVVSSNWVKNVATYPPSDVIDDVVINENMAAKAILTCRPNSHHFQERTLILDQPVKVGRSIARAKPTGTNAIFDCKVLSRHHALLWYENGKFFLQDTKSSNGTFVNNSRLTQDNGHHELSSGDIVQFGVDVIENNRKVTHGCIIATIKLYLPDGKEAKASPIADGNTHGIVPLDDLYRLNQIIQEANQREQCLETKLTELQHVVDETRKSAEESWQAYVGEERLLSRVSALETQLQRASKNWSEERFREELTRLQEDNEAYQISAKAALEKLHADRLQALALAVEQERARISAEQEALIAKEQFAQAQVELEEIARQLGEQQLEANEQRTKLEQCIQDLETKLETESAKLLELQLKFQEKNALTLSDIQNLGSIVSETQSHIIYNDDMKCKEDMLSENEDSESLTNQSNGLSSHINLTVGPVEEKYESEKVELEPNADEKNSNDLRNEQHEEVKRVTFNIPDDSESDQDKTDPSDESEESTERADTVDSKTLKYQFHAAQNELKRKIETLESIGNTYRNKIVELDKALNEEKIISKDRTEENEVLKQEVVLLRQKWKECSNENQQYRDKMSALNSELETALEKLKQAAETKEKIENVPAEPNILKPFVSLEQLAQIEEELVLLKERYAQVSEDKMALRHDLATLKTQYDAICNRFYNKFFWYVAPLVAMVFYLLISAMIS
ncbi:sarcolemmal membrane-associated protein isoform X1 [Diorhabda carinulata]|uniref:sarcolemmal membrane-associated protein isoform X1 n=2 Tax=Diorhabda carinulata TaxID=1163345 RepID=UPI0025A094FA|nr:sarcolemmal membrane-associated protein isoform X1 [Diorhabda carinulata]